ncbi:hypothetical protein C5B42_05065 [Candidatus Cerribacteria bacterium 'Amazon FNV 2010 28 9']|uniref:Uncharacterized protein n=1 Tax=Candidatus Cerribacteria bacterium 'Amazon FNV 2010 28 9' TaxID=2081795 RepID=A0A317JME1_9BACT|nr:MAG: hypothetical protein C5B42_05065 [Candidatus Cerribacteria bacterium 'Amazon FNV 2010 28 9']
MTEIHSGKWSDPALNIEEQVNNRLERSLASLHKQARRAMAAYLDDPTRENAESVLLAEHDCDCAQADLSMYNRGEDPYDTI